MKTIGLIGGVSWHSTLVYYRLINQQVAQRLGGHHSAPLALYSFGFAEIERLQKTGDWAGIAKKLSAAALKLQAAGAEALIICSDTLHSVVPQIKSECHLPIIEIGPVIASAVKAAGISRVGLLGTAYAMQGKYFPQKLNEVGVEVLVPDPNGQDQVHAVIFDELTKGKLSDGARAKVQGVSEQLIAAGAEGLILGCTELGSLPSSDYVTTNLFDSTVLHAKAAARFCVGEAL